MIELTYLKKQYSISENFRAYDKPNPVCPICTGWLQDQGEYLKCSGCGFMVKKPKRLKKL